MILRARNVNTVGQLAAMTHSQVYTLPIRGGQLQKPVVLVDAMQEYLTETNGTKTQTNAFLTSIATANDIQQTNKVIDKQDIPQLNSENNNNDDSLILTKDTLEYAFSALDDTVEQNNEAENGNICSSSVFI